MKANFYEPQRQSPAGIISSALYSMQQIIRASFVPLVILFVRSDKNLLLMGGLGVFGLLLISVVFGFIYYRKFTFYIDIEKNEFIINKGIFSRTHLAIPLGKIQQININQGFIQKLVGVYSLSLDTPGTESKEVTISAINGHLALALKEVLREGKTDIATASASELTDTLENQNEEKLIDLDNSTLLKVGLTSNYGRSILLLAGFGYAIIHNVKDLFKALDRDPEQLENYLMSGVTVITLCIVLIILLFALLGTNIIRTFIRYYEFQISKKGTSLLISSGLLAKKTTLVNPSKIQITSYSQNFFQKKINLTNIVLKQANAGDEQTDGEVKTNNLEVPGCSEQEKQKILELIFNRLPNSEVTFRPNYRFLNLPIFFAVVLPAALYALLYIYIDDFRPFLPLAILYLVITSVAIYINYTQYKIMVSDQFIIKQEGVWDITQEIIEPYKIQSITTSQYIWHKSADVGHINLNTAGGVISFKYGNYSEIKHLANWWLYQVESQNRNWM
jgi:putative membrane protein